MENSVLLVVLSVAVPVLVYISGLFIFIYKSNKELQNQLKDLSERISKLEINTQLVKVE